MGAADEVGFFRKNVLRKDEDEKNHVRRFCLKCFVSRFGVRQADFKKFSGQNIQHAGGGHGVNLLS